MYRGELVEEGPVRRIFTNPRHPYTRGLLDCLPTLGSDKRQAPLVPIAGQVESALARSPGCGFAGRCAHVEIGRCTSHPIPIAEVYGEPDHHVACVRADELARWTRRSGATVTHDAGVVGEPMVAVHHLTKIYEPRRRWLRGPRAPVRAVSDVDLAAARGRTLAIVGESGCGKSTIAKVLSGLEVATAGGDRESPDRDPGRSRRHARLHLARSRGRALSRRYGRGDVPRDRRRARLGRACLRAAVPSLHGGAAVGRPGARSGSRRRAHLARGARAARRRDPARLSVCDALSPPYRPDLRRDAAAGTALRGRSPHRLPHSRRRVATIADGPCRAARGWTMMADMASTHGAAVVIVGGGVTGLGTGWRLARAGVDVLVLEKGIVGWEASGRNGGGATHVYSPFGLEEQRLWPQMDELLVYPTEYQPFRIGVALSETQLALARRWAEIGESRGFRWESLDRRQLKELVPIVGDNAIGGTYLHFGGHANPQRTVQAYAWALQDLGGRIVQHATATGLTQRGGRVTAVETTRGTFGADVVVIAAGPQTGAFAEMLGAWLPLAPARVEVIATEPIPLMRVGGVAGNGLYGRQTLRGNLVYGGGPHEWINVPDMATPEHANTPLVRHLARRLAELFPGAAHVRVIRAWSGLVENTPDGLPVVERLTRPDNVVIATMSSVGFGLSPAVGRAVCELVQHGRCQFADLGW